MIAPAQPRSVLSVPDETDPVFNPLFESASYVMVATDSEGIIVRANATGGVRFSYRPWELSEMPTRLVEPGVAAAPTSSIALLRARGAIPIRPGTR